MITYLVSPNNKPGSRLTKAQRHSSLFSEAPVVAGKILRRGSPVLKLNEDQYKLLAVRIKMLEKAGSITVTKVVSAPAEEVVTVDDKKLETIGTVTVPLEDTPTAPVETKKKGKKKE